MSLIHMWAGLILVVCLEVFVLLLCALKKQFIPASDYKSAIAVAKRIQDKGFVPIINLLGEHYTSRKKVDETINEYLYLIGLLHDAGIKAKISVKPTQIGLAIFKELYLYNILQIARRAHNHKIPLEIDVESLKYLDDTLSVFLEIPGEFLVRQAVQAYLKRSKEDIGKLIGWHKKVRLVKGAYAESDLSKLETRAQMENFAEQLLLLGNEPAIATIRDKDLIGFLTIFHGENKIEKKQFIFQMLYGLSDEMKEVLRDLGFRIEVYVPIGHWYKALPYIYRRIKEILTKNTLYVTISVM